MAKTIHECDSDADSAIAAMVTTVVGTALVPATVNWSLTAAAMGTGCIAIGKSIWSHVKQR